MICDMKGQTTERRRLKRGKMGTEEYLIHPKLGEGGEGTIIIKEGGRWVGGGKVDLLKLFIAGRKGRKRGLYFLSHDDKNYQKRRVVCFNEEKKTGRFLNRKGKGRERKEKRFLEFSGSRAEGGRGRERKEILLQEARKRKEQKGQADLPRLYI